MVDGFQRGLGDFEHYGPVGAFSLFCRGGFAAVGKALSGELGRVVRLVVGGVIREYCGPIEWAVVFGEVEPAFIANALGAAATDSDADDMRGAIEEVFGEGNEGGIADLLSEGVDRHRIDHLVIRNGFAILEGHSLLISIDFFNSAILAKSGLLFRKSLCNSDPDSTGTTVSWKAEGRIGSPISSGLLEYHVLDHTFDIRCCHSFAKPCALHLWTINLCKSAGFLYRSRIPWWLGQPKP